MTATTSQTAHRRLDNYYAALEQEVLRETACGLIARVLRHMDRHGATPDDKDCADAIVYWQLVKTEQNILSSGNDGNDMIRSVETLLKDVAARYREA
jgi:hypothetical protein